MAAEKEPKDEALAKKLLEMRTLLVFGQVNQRMAQRVIGQLLVMDGLSNDPIRMVLTSEGGHVEAGFAIYDVMRFVKSPIHCVGAGWVACTEYLCKPEHAGRCPEPSNGLHRGIGGGTGTAFVCRMEPGC